MKREEFGRPPLRGVPLSAGDLKRKGAKATEGSLQLIQKADEIVKILADNKNRLLSFGLENNLDVP